MDSLKENVYENMMNNQINKRKMSKLHNRSNTISTGGPLEQLEYSMNKQNEIIEHAKNKLDEKDKSLLTAASYGEILLNENEQLSQQVEQTSEQYEEQIQQLKILLIEQQEKIDEYETSENNYIERLQKKRRLYEKLQSKYDDAMNEIESLKSQLRVVEIKYNASKEDAKLKHHFEHALVHAVEQKDEVQRQLISIVNSNQSLRTSIQKLTSELEKTQNLEQEYDILSQKYDELQEKMIELLKENQQKVQYTKDVQVNLQKAEDEVQKLQKIAETLMANVEERDQLIEQLNNQSDPRKSIENVVSEAYSPFQELNTTCQSSVHSYSNMSSVSKPLPLASKMSGKPPLPPMNKMIPSTPQRTSQALSLATEFETMLENEMNTSNMVICCAGDESIDASNISNIENLPPWVSSSNKQCISTTNNSHSIPASPIVKGMLSIANSPLRSMVKTSANEKVDLICEYFHMTALATKLLLMERENICTNIPIEIMYVFALEERVGFQYFHDFVQQKLRQWTRDNVSAEQLMNIIAHF